MSVAAAAEGAFMNTVAAFNVPHQMKWKQPGALQNKCLAAECILLKHHLSSPGKSKVYKA